MLTIKGLIPEKIAIVSSKSQPVYRTWEEQKDDLGAPEMVTPAFVSEAENVKTFATAVKWAEHSREYYDPLLKKRISSIDPVRSEVRDNIPFKGLKIVGLEHRGSNGRAYKVVTGDNYYFDLREDVMLDAMITVGINPGGNLNGQYQWAKIGSHMKIVRVGSEIHTALVSTTKKRSLKPINSNSLIPGGIYETKSNQRYLYIGKVDWIEFNYILPKEYNYYAKMAKNFILSKKEHKNEDFWFTFSKSANNDPIESFKKDIGNQYQYMTTDTPKTVVVEMVQKIDIAGFIDNIRSEMANKLEKDLASIRTTIHSSLNYEEEKIPSICWASKLNTITEANKSIQYSYEYQELIKRL